MGGFLYPEALLLWMERRSFEKKMREARGWPIAEAEVNGWKIVPAGPHGEFGRDSQIEAGFHFVLNGEYFGGYVQSEPMVHREAEKLGQGSPKIRVRYNPADPDKNFVLPEDNQGNLPFKIYTGPKAS
jgi:Protein of unknown function (DUF3592)